MIVEPLPQYDSLLAGHHHKEPGHTSRRMRGTDDWLLVATLSGRGRFGDLIAPPGTLALIAPRTPHDYGTAKDAEGWQILWVHFHPPLDWLELLRWPPSDRGTALLSPLPWTDIETCFHEVVRLSVLPSRRRRQIAMNALERLFLLCDNAIPEAVPPLRVQPAIDEIYRRLSEPLTLEDLSASVHLSPSRFSHLFRDELGMSPMQYVAQQRLARARTLLERTTLSVSEVAAEVGMEPFHFSARFKAQVGLPPREYRASSFA